MVDLLSYGSLSILWGHGRDFFNLLSLKGTKQMIENRKVFKPQAITILKG